MVSLAQEGAALREERRYLRAAKKFAVACDRTKALPQLGSDSIIVALLYAQDAEARLMVALTRPRSAWKEPGAPGNAEEGDPEMYFRKALLLLQAAGKILRQRRAAGTLLRGTCRLEEEAYDLYEEREIRGGSDPPQPSHEAAMRCFGENTHFRVGAHALNALGVFADNLPASPLTFYASGIRDGGAAPVMEMLALVRATCDLMLLPRLPAPHDWMSHEEVFFARRCSVSMPAWNQSRVALFPGGSELLAPIMLLLQQAWRQLEHSPPMRVAMTDVIQQSYTRGNAESRAAVCASLAEMPKRSCAHCGAIEALHGDYKQCARCTQVRYCCKEHQVAHWATHKAACRRRR